MPRISADMVSDAPQFTNTLKDREIDLRGRKIPAIENLGTTLDQFDTYDLTNNEIRRLGGFPRLNRLQTLVLINNRVTRISSDLGETVPNLSDLNLKNNSVAHLAALKPLAGCPKLVRLCLIGNPVHVAEHYRAYVIHLVPHIRLLDFQRVKDEERRQSAALFEGPKGAALLEEIEQAGAKDAAKGDDSGAASASGGGGERNGGPSKDEVARIKKAIAAASTLEEVNALEAQLKQGALGGAGAMDTDK